MPDLSNLPAPLHTGYRALWLLWIAGGIGLEVIALRRAGRGDTLSEGVWAVLHLWPGALTFAFLGWLMYHWPWGRAKPLGWWDVFACLVGIGYWLMVRNYGRP